MMKEINDELECKIVTSRMKKLLYEDNFELSVDYLKFIHKYLFHDIYDFAGEFRDINFSKHEETLHRDSVAYGNYKLIKELLEFDISLEKKKSYTLMSEKEVVNSIALFSANIWQVHPFREGNTRTVALFTEKYLLNLGFNINNFLFKSKSCYFRNALVRSNYFNRDMNIKENINYLVKFYENVIFKKKNKLLLRDLYIKELFDNKE